MSDRPPSPRSPGDGRSRIVLVEDHARVREHLTSLLEGAGFAVVATADSVATGLAAVRAHRPGIAVLDNRLPDGRGVDLALVVREEMPGVRILIHSGAITPEETSRALRSGVLEVVTKDVRARNLLDALQRHTGRGARPR